MKMTLRSACLLLLVVSISWSGERLTARLETTKDVARHLRVTNGRVMIGSQHELTVLRNYDVKIVVREDLNLREKLVEAELPDFLLQVKPGRLEMGISAFTTLPSSVLSGGKSLLDFKNGLPKHIRGYQHVYPYYLQVPFDLRVRMRGVEGDAGRLDIGVYSSHGLVQKPTDEVKRMTLQRGLTKIDGHLRRALGGPLMRVSAKREQGQATFLVKLKNPHRFPIGGCLQLPRGDDYRIKDRVRGFHIAAGAEQELKFQLDSVDHDNQPRWPSWWLKKTKRGEYYRQIGAFRFARLEFNVRDDAQPQDFLVQLPEAIDSSIDIMKDVNLKRDTYSLGLWKMKGRGLAYPGGSVDPYVRFQVQPPSEYDLRIVFSRHEIERPLTVVLPHSQSHLVCEVGGSKGAIGLHVKAPFRRHPAWREMKGLVKADTRHELLIRVRKDRVDLLLDGQRMIRHETDFSDLQPQVTAARPTIKTHGPTVLHSVSLTPIRRGPHQLNYTVQTR